jgi:centrosomal protein CEP290
LQRENERYEDEVREYEKNRTQILEQKYLSGPEQEKNLKIISQKNKIIGELETENEELQNENLKLNEHIKESKQIIESYTLEMDRTTKELIDIKDLLKRSDAEIKTFKQENDQLKFQLENFKQSLDKKTTSEGAIMDKYIQEYELKLQNKDSDIKKLTELVLELRENLDKNAIDSNQNTVSSLTKALNERDKQILVLKQQIEECKKEMDKSANVINSLNKTFYENSKMFSKSHQYNLSKQAESKITYLENMLKETDSRSKDFQEQLVQKEKELVEALNRMRDYESGDYQLQQAVNEIKALKKQISIRDRDIEKLTQHLNKLDSTLNDVLEENDDFRAKLGMQPKEKINLDELNNLRAIRAQENRAITYVLQRENENLLEENNRLHLKIRKLAKQIRSKEIVAHILEEGENPSDLSYLNDLVESKKNNGKTKDKQSEDSSQSKNVDSEKLLKENEFMKKRNEQIMQILLEFENENKYLEKGLREVHQQLTSINLNGNYTKGGKGRLNGDSFQIKCPTLDKLLNVIFLLNSKS